MALMETQGGPGSSRAETYESPVGMHAAPTVGCEYSWNSFTISNSTWSRVLKNSKGSVCVFDSLLYAFFPHPSHTE